MGYQVKGTAHFCQTFATIIYLNLNNVGKYKLTPGKYGENIYIAIRFWIDILENPLNNELTNYILDEIRKWRLVGEDTDVKFNSKTTLLLDTNITLNNINKKLLIDFLKKLQYYALQQYYNGCEEG